MDRRVTTNRMRRMSSYSTEQPTDPSKVRLTVLFSMAARSESRLIRTHCYKMKHTGPPCVAVLKRLSECILRGDSNTGEMWPLHPIESNSFAAVAQGRCTRPRAKIVRISAPVSHSNYLSYSLLKMGLCNILIMKGLRTLWKMGG